MAGQNLSGDCAISATHAVPVQDTVLTSHLNGSPQRACCHQHAFKHMQGCSICAAGPHCAISRGHSVCLDDAGSQVPGAWLVTRAAAALMDCSLSSCLHLTLKLRQLSKCVFAHQMQARQLHVNKRMLSTFQIWKYWQQGPADRP